MHQKFTRVILLTLFNLLANYNTLMLSDSEIVFPVVPKKRFLFTFKYLFLLEITVKKIIFPKNLL